MDPRVVATMAALALALFAPTAGAGEPEATASEPPQWKFSVESDLTRLVLGSLSVHLMARPAGAPRFRFGIGRVGGALPRLFHTLFDPNGDGWEATEQGGALQAFYHSSDDGNAFFFGGYARFDYWEWRRSELPGKVTGAQIFLMPAAGFRWFPAGKGVYVAPLLGFGVSIWDSGAGKIGPHTYEPLRFFPLPTIHVGYEG
jgi:hypothetical protein